VAELQSAEQVLTVCTRRFDGDCSGQPGRARADRLEADTCPGDGYRGCAGERGVAAGVSPFADY
jgi:hypothetical protein